MSKSEVEFSGCSNPPSSPISLWYRKPAAAWVEALPLGNGRLGAMLFGGIRHERVALNESSLWSGTPTPEFSPQSAHVLPAIREAVFKGDFARADELIYQLQGPWTQAYMPLGDLRLHFDNPPELVADYRRSLDLDTAVQTTRFNVGQDCHLRECFVSAADQVVVLRISCSTPGQVSLRAGLDTKLAFRSLESADGNTLIMSAKAPLDALPMGHSGKLTYAEDVRGEGMNAQTRLRVVHSGGTARVDDGTLSVTNADSVVLILSAATSYNGPDRSPGLDGKDPAAHCSADLQAASKRSYEELLRRHLDDYQPLMRRVRLDLGEATTGEFPTDERVVRWHESEDPQLAALLFQYGRYLLISSSRDGGTAANLQGLWNETTAPPWSSNFTANINFEMNYWPAETTHLAECHRPMLDVIGAAALRGRSAARRTYGASGWVTHHNTDLWGACWSIGSGQGRPEYATWPMGGAWLAHHLWEHYAFQPDAGYLRETAYPLMKGAAEFFLDFLVEDAQGRLVTVPSTSPETKFETPTGEIHAVSAGSTMDMSLLRELFKNTADAADLLEVDSDFAAKLRAARARLLPLQICSDGTLAEWADPTWKAAEKHHKHLSHLIGFFPLADITLAQPQLAEAVRQSLIDRRDDSTGWSLGWKLNMWARLGDGEHCLGLMKYILRPVGFGGGAEYWGGVYLNLFGAHPPFQIDGNFGYTSGLAEMLLQSHDGQIRLLPALPASWRTGSVCGLRARGGVEVDQNWVHGRLTGVSLRSTHATTVTLRYQDQTAEITLVPGKTISLDGHLRPTETPLVRHLYTADPSAHVFNGKIYLYPSHDRESGIPANDNGDQYAMNDYHVLSMDAVGGDVTDHGIALSLGDVRWASSQLWAPDAAVKDGRYFLYFPARDHAGIFRIGVATADSPVGPFVPEADYIPGSFSIDPCSFVDDDGQAYLYFGGLWGGQLQCWQTGTFAPGAVEPADDQPALGPWVARLSSDMLSFADPPRQLLICDPEGNPLLARDHDRRFFEGPWLHRRGDLYYLSYSTGDTHYLVYATSKSPFGPFTYRGRLLEPVLGWTTHHSIVEFQDRWFLFHHDASLSGGVGHLRCVKVKELDHGDGVIRVHNPSLP